MVKITARPVRHIRSDASGPTRLVLYVRLGAYDLKYLRGEGSDT